MGARAVQLDLYRTVIPMRRFEHAAATRDVAEAIVVRLELDDGTVGWGETLPRPYVTGETLESVPADIEQHFAPAMWGREVDGAELPVADPPGRTTNAARCAAGLAWFDAWARRHWARMGMRRYRSRPQPPVRVSGVLGSSDPSRTARQLRLMRWYGLRDFKLKLGLGEDVDAENLRLVAARIGRGLREGKGTLRVDVNGGWSTDQTPQRVAALVPCRVCLVEQPVFGPPEALIELAQRCELPLMADESLLTAADARAFIAAPGRKVWLNLRLSKNGGIWPCLDIAFAASAAEANVPFVFGCMVGESSILSAAQRSLLALGPAAKFVEGNYGRFLLASDLTNRSLRFGYGGRLRPLLLAGGHLGLKVEPKRLARYGRLIKTLRG